jgi:GTP-binding protein Era
MRSGFATLVGRPNVGKSTLLNTLVGQKVSIVSDKPQTTRTQVRAVLNRPDAQLVFVDTPGIHKPVTALGARLNATARDALGDLDVACLVLDATQPFGRGDQFVASRLAAERTVVVVNKIDRASPAHVAEQLAAAAVLDASAYYPVSARNGAGVPELLDELVARLPEGPRYFPDDVVTDVPEAFWVAELVREQLLVATRDELPYSIATRVTEWDWPHIKVEIVVERESQKGMVIGRHGSVLKTVGTAVRSQLAPGAFLELVVKVDKDWQRRPERIARLGY